MDWTECVCVSGRRGITRRRRFMPSFGLLLGNRKCLLSLFLERGGVKLDSVTICPELVDFLLSCPLFLSNNWLFPFADKGTVGDIALHQQVGLWQPPNRPITVFFEKHLGPFGFLLSPLPVVLVVVYLCYVVGFEFFSFCGIPIGTEKYNIYTWNIFFLKRY